MNHHQLSSGRTILLRLELLYIFTANELFERRCDNFNVEMFCFSLDPIKNADFLIVVYFQLVLRNDIS